MFSGSAWFAWIHSTRLANGTYTLVVFVSWYRAAVAGKQKQLKQS